MTVFRSKRDGELYLLAICKPPKYTGEWLVSAKFCWSRKQISKWKEVPQYKQKDFLKVAKI